jgi:hypothetical protein
MTHHDAFSIEAECARARAYEVEGMSVMVRHGQIKMARFSQKLVRNHDALFFRKTLGKRGKHNALPQNPNCSMA